VEEVALGDPLMIPGLREFLLECPGMILLPITGSKVVISGEFTFLARAKDHPDILDSYRLRIALPEAFPADLPIVTELENRIPRNGDFHVNSDGSLCLGSPLRLLLKLSNTPTLPGFVSQCLIPYLYAISHKLRFGGPLPFSELKHGQEGEFQDYMELFTLTRPEQVRQVFRLLGMKRRRANKAPCPCECGQRVGRCSFNRKLRKMRQLAGRSWFRKYWQHRG
jgi:hypothetical protein